ncbi:MAG TPA: hypothetical protein VNJ31_04455 [Methyloceanibacter sp.]|nr:hypothetical protein [Methyloceanibacter sp.]
MAGTGARPPQDSATTAGEASHLSHGEAAEYIAAMLEGLRHVAKSARMPFLAYLIDVALEEAKTQKAPRA